MHFSLELEEFTCFLPCSDSTRDERPQKISKYIYFHFLSHLWLLAATLACDDVGYKTGACITHLFN